MKPTVWSIAGTDSTGLAGLANDLRVFHAFRLVSAFAVTAVTVQGRNGVEHLELLSSESIEAQLRGLKKGAPPQAVKIGMLGSGRTTQQVAEAVSGLAAPIVLDPVLVASWGGSLASAGVPLALRKFLLPKVTCVTPNRRESETFTGSTEVPTQARRWREMGAQEVLIKGGHQSGPLCSDYWESHQGKAWIHSQRQERSARGTGCFLSSAMTSACALGFSPLDAILLAKTFLNATLRLSRGQRLEPLFWPSLLSPSDLPWLGDKFSLPFPKCERLGFYPIVDSAEWVERLTGVGVDLIQLRIKHTRGEALEAQVRKSVAIAKAKGARVIVNDYWDLALSHGAYGVHLGQEDLASADLPAIAKAGLRLGLSTHCFEEVAKAHAIGPSYVAIGPLYPTTAKAMPFGPQGLEGLRLWRQLLDYPLVAIGGITLEKARHVQEAGADGIAVISDITQAAHPEARAQGWLELFSTRAPLHLQHPPGRLEGTTELRHGLCP